MHVRTYLSFQDYSPTDANDRNRVGKNAQRKALSIEIGFIVCVGEK